MPNQRLPWPTRMFPALVRTFAATVIVAISWATSPRAWAELRAGAAIVDVSPRSFPVLVNGGFRSNTADSIQTPVNARAIVVQDDQTTIGLVVVDSCMIPREIIEDVKQRVAALTSMRPDTIMISATHTHSAPSAFGALGTDADLTYIPLLRERLVESLLQAENELQPAAVGWASADAREYTAVRRGIFRRDLIELDPFGNRTVQATMHAARNLDHVAGPSGPEDPELAIVTFTSLSGVPIAMLCNFSMHYFSGERPISADYFGLFCNHIQDAIKTAVPNAKPVAVMSHGCSGDIFRADYFKQDEVPDWNIKQYAEGLAGLALKAYVNSEYQIDATIAMQERRLPMRYRVPDQQRLQWAKQTIEAMTTELPMTKQEVYAREQILLHEMQSTEVVVQGIRIGDIAIATTPNETYALTGLKIKRQSPLAKTMVIELANGADGYIPPPEQHYLGGYNTWPARSAGLEIQAEPRITAAAIELLESVAEQPRRSVVPSDGPAAEEMRSRGPLAYYRMDEMSGTLARDCSGNDRHGHYEPGVVFFLKGDDRYPFAVEGDVNRSAHFAGGRMTTRLEASGDESTVVMHVWNGVPMHEIGMHRWLVSRDHPEALSSSGQHLGVVCTEKGNARLTMIRPGVREPLVGESPLERFTWYRVVWVCSPTGTKVYLDDKLELESEWGDQFVPPAKDWFFGGRSDNQDNWEGRIDEIAIFDHEVSLN